MVPDGHKYVSPGWLERLGELVSAALRTGRHDTAEARRDCFSYCYPLAGERRRLAPERPFKP